MAKFKMPKCQMLSGDKLTKCRAKAVADLAKTGVPHVDAVARVNRATKKR